MKAVLLISAVCVISCASQPPKRPPVVENPRPLTLFLDTDPRQGIAQQNVHDSVDSIDRSTDSAQRILDAIGATSTTVRSDEAGAAGAPDAGGAAHP